MLIRILAQADGSTCENRTAFETKLNFYTLISIEAIPSLTTLYSDVVCIGELMLDMEHIAVQAHAHARQLNAGIDVTRPAGRRFENPVNGADAYRPAQDNRA